MQQLFDDSVWIIVLGSGLWALGFPASIADLANSLSQLRSAQDSPLRDSASRSHISENVWLLAGGAVLALLLGFGVDVAVRLWFDWGSPFWSALLMIALLSLAFLGGLGVVALMLRGEGQSYAILRANLLEETRSKLSAEQAKQFRAQLEQVDNRKRHIRFGLRDRARLRPVRARLDALAADFAAVPPTGYGAIRPVKWRTANAYLWRGNPVRLAPAFLTAIVFVASVLEILATGGHDALGWVFAGAAVLATALSLFFALFASRVTLASKVAWHAVYVKQRFEALRVLEELERSSRKGVVGLGERVTKALQILRDQQG